jgi:hypothetical protein
MRASEWNSPNQTILDDDARERKSARERKRPVADAGDGDRSL